MAALGRRGKMRFSALSGGAPADPSESDHEIVLEQNGVFFFKINKLRKSI